MKKYLAIILSLVIILPLFTWLIGCGGDDSNQWMQDLSGYVADIGDATALGIQESNSNDGSSTYSINLKSSTVQGSLFSQIGKSSYDERNEFMGKKKERYIVKRTTEFSANDPVIDESGLKQITFTKTANESKDNKEDVTITQDQIGGVIDKLYVLNNYTFISYVPDGESKRPSNANLTYDSDGIAIFDKCNYYSNNERQSFIIDNITGYVYKIKDFNIKEIQGGLLVSADDNFIYDFKINENDEVEIFSLFTNDTIEWYSCFKDKYGNKFINNNRLNTYDATTNTYFYVHNPYDDDGQFDGNYIYELTSNDEAIAIEVKCNFLDSQIVSAHIILENNTTRKLTKDDTFKIYYNKNTNSRMSYYIRDYINAASSLPKQDWTISRSDSLGAYKVANGVIYAYNYHDGYASEIQLIKHDAITNTSTYVRVNTSASDKLYYNVSHLENLDVIIEYYNGKLYYYKDIWSSFNQSALQYNEVRTSASDVDNLSGYSGYTANLILDNCSIDVIEDAILTYGVNGNTYYDIVAEQVNGKIVINQYVKGTYQKPQIKVVFQPLNKK